MSGKQWLGHGCCAAGLARTVRALNRSRASREGPCCLSACLFTPPAPPAAGTSTSRRPAPRRCQQLTVTAPPNSCPLLPPFPRLLTKQLRATAPFTLAVAFTSILQFLAHALPFSRNSRPNKAPLHALFAFPHKRDFFFLVRDSTFRHTHNQTWRTIRRWKRLERVRLFQFARKLCSWIRWDKNLAAS